MPPASAVSIIRRRWWSVLVLGVILAVLLGRGGHARAQQTSVRACEDALHEVHWVVRDSPEWTFMNCSNQPAGFFAQHPANEDDEDDDDDDDDAASPLVVSAPLPREYAGLPQYTLMLGGKWTASTPSHRVELDIGPAETTILPAAVAQGALGEVLMQEEWIGPVTLLARDNGQPVNHQLAVRTIGSEGHPLSNIVPLINVTDQTTGATRDVGPLALLAHNAVLVDLHYGQNLYLPDGMYTVTVTLGNEAATFADIAVNADTGPHPVSAP